jgi:hypothetical protein
LKQVAERIRIHANVREIEKLQFTIINKAGDKWAKARESEKSQDFDVLKGELRDIRLMDLWKQCAKAPVKGNFWEFLDLDTPENYYSIEYVVSKKP